MALFSWFLGRFGSQRQASSSRTAAPQARPWEIHWEGLIYKCEDEYDLSWDGETFFARDLDVDGALIKVEVKKMSDGSVWVWLINPVTVCTEVLVHEDSGRYHLALEPKVRSFTTDLKVAIIEFARDGQLSGNLFS